MKKFTPLLLLLSILFTTLSFGQRKIIPSDTLEISGDVKNNLTIITSELNKYPSINLNDFILSNQLGETKDTIKNLKGIFLKPILENVELIADKPKVYNEYYFTFISSDGYKAVFSWNEIFNTETGNNLYLITEMNGKKIKDLDERFLLISSKDFKTGRRYIRGLSKIIIKRVD